MTARVLALLLLMALAGCASPKVTVAVGGSIDRVTVERWRDGQPSPENRLGLLTRLLSLPPAPIIYGNPTQPPTPPNPAWTPFNPLLALLHTGPGGSVVTEQHLQSLQPALMSLGQFSAANPGLSLAQLWSTPQGQAAHFALLSIFQPLGLWNPAVRQWLIQKEAELRSILTILYGDLLAGPPPQPNAPPLEPPPVLFDPSQSVAELIGLWWRRDWVAIAGAAPRLIHSLTRHLGYLEPQVVIYGKRSGGYTAGVIVEDPGGQVHVINEDGYTTGTSGRHRYHQGREDLTLNYLLVDVSGGKVDTPDVQPSDLFLWAKQASGGDASLLDRTRTSPNSMISADLDWNGSHIRLAAGATPSQKLGGVILEQRLASETLRLHAAAGVLYESAFGGKGGPLGFFDLEASVLSPSLRVAGDGGSAAVWGSATVSLSGLANEYGAQGDARLIPELHSEIRIRNTATIAFTLGSTLALVPYGRADLDRPARSLALRHVRTHVGLVLKAKAGPTVLEWGGVAEFSRLISRARLWTGVSWDAANVKMISELDQVGDYLEAYVGASVSLHGLTASALRRADNDDYRVQVGYEHKF